MFPTLYTNCQAIFQNQNIVVSWGILRLWPSRSTQDTSEVVNILPVKLSHRNPLYICIYVFLSFCICGRLLNFKVFQNIRGETKPRTYVVNYVIYLNIFKNQDSLFPFLKDWHFTAKFQWNTIFNILFIGQIKFIGCLQLSPHFWNTKGQTAD
jgi:hypothetical protein